MTYPYIIYPIRLYLHTTDHCTAVSSLQQLSVLSALGCIVLCDSVHHTAPFFFPLAQLYLKCTNVHFINVTVQQHDALSCCTVMGDPVQCTVIKCGMSEFYHSSLQRSFGLHYSVNGRHRKQLFSCSDQRFTMQ